MSLHINYHKIKPTPELISAIEDEVMAISRFLLKGGRWSIELDKKKSECFITIKTSSPLGFFQAQASSQDFSTAITQGFQKLIQQIKKRKEAAYSKKHVKHTINGKITPLRTSADKQDHLYFPVTDGTSQTTPIQNSIQHKKVS